MGMDFRANKEKILANAQHKDAHISKGIRNILSAEGAENQVQYIPLDQIEAFKDHPFRVRDDEAMAQLVESIHQSGVLTPATVRKLGDDRYEMISGHRRMCACRKLGLTEIPAIVLEIDDDEAVIRMVDANLQREHILPSEKAFAYQKKMKAMRKQGQRNDITSGQVVPKLGESRTGDEIGKEAGESYKTVQRYIRLTYLLRTLLNMVDEEKVPFMTGVALSYLTEDEQAALLYVMEQRNITPSLQQAEELKRRSKDGTLDVAAIQDVFFPKPVWQTYSERLAQAEQEEAELAEREAVAERKLREDFAKLQTRDPDEPPLVITHGESLDEGVGENELKHFHSDGRASKKSTSADSAEAAAKALCKQLDGLLKWLDHETADRFQNIMDELKALLDEQGLLK